MQVGKINGSSFDISSLVETDALLLRNDYENKFIYKDESNRAVMLRRTVTPTTVTTIGTLLEISEVDGYAMPVHDATRKHFSVGKLMAEIDWADTSAFKTVTFEHEGVTRTAILAPVFLTL
jgi:hypothetical protein